MGRMSQQSAVCKIKTCTVYWKHLNNIGATDDIPKLAGPQGL